MDTHASAPPPRCVLIFAEPSLERARLGRRLGELAIALDSLQVRDLYELYPDFFIDAGAERALLAEANLVIFVFQLRSYCMPALLVEWMDTVLRGSRLPAARCWVIVGCSGAAEDYCVAKAHGHPAADYLFCIEQTATSCGMRWIEPHVFYNAEQADTADIDAHAEKLERMISEALGAVHG